MKNLLSICWSKVIDFALAILTIVKEALSNRSNKSK